jgi:hypothetical protein
MSIIYIHGVKVRAPEHGIALGKSFARWLGPKLAVGGNNVDYLPVYWGDVAARFRWNLESRPKTAILAQGGAGAFAGLGSLREASDRTPLDNAVQRPAAQGPVINAAGAVPSVAAAPALTMIPRNKRADFLADLYLAVHPRAKNSEDAIAEDARLASLAAAAAEVAESWDTIVASEATDDARASRLISTVEERLSGSTIIPQGGFADWMSKAGETLRRAATWPGDAVSTVFGEVRPVVNEFVAYFIGDVLAYINERDIDGAPGVIPGRVLGALRTAQQRKKATGEKIVVVSHSMGGQLLYDALTFYAPKDPTLAGLSVDHWISCGAQVSLFAELTLFKGQPANVAMPRKLPRPAAVAAWTNFYDRNDLVGFIMSPIFEDVTDKEYDTGYGLAFAHTGYLARPSFFEAVAAQL